MRMRIAFIGASVVCLKNVMGWGKFAILAKNLSLKRCSLKIDTRSFCSKISKGYVSIFVLLFQFKHNLINDISASEIHSLAATPSPGCACVAR